MRIIDLVKITNSNVRDKASKKQIKDNHHFANFEFKTRAERDNIELVSGEINQASAVITHFDTDLSGLNVVTDNSMIGVEQNQMALALNNESTISDEEKDPMEKATVDSMEVYEDLQDHKKRLVLTNIRQFHEEEIEEVTMTDKQYLAYVKES